MPENKSLITLFYKEFYSVAGWVLLVAGEGHFIVLLGIDLETAVFGDVPGKQFSLPGKFRERDFPEGFDIFLLVTLVQGDKFS